MARLLIFVSFLHYSRLSLLHICLSKIKAPMNYGYLLYLKVSFKIEFYYEIVQKNRTT